MSDPTHLGFEVIADAGSVSHSLGMRIKKNALGPNGNENYLLNNKSTYIILFNGPKRQICNKNYTNISYFYYCMLLHYRVHSHKCN